MEKNVSIPWIFVACLLCTRHRAGHRGGGGDSIERTTLASMLYIGGSQSMFPDTATSPFACKGVSHADSQVPPYTY